MVLAIDIGNTNIVVGVWDDDNLLFVSRLATDKLKTEDGYAIELKNVFELYNVDSSKIQGCIISSVVPPISSTVAYAVERLTGEKPIVVSPGIKTGLNIKTDDPAQLGSDIVVGAVAALSKYPKPIIIFDMGTATKISIIDANSSFLGCAILPGIRIGFDALSDRTAQLPQVGLEAPGDIIGKNTIDSMRSGAVFGTASMMDGMIERIENRLAQKATVIATGGNLGDIAKYCKSNVIHDANLILEGLLIIYRKNVPVKL
jgi:type III pantothenate kinase